VTCGYGPVPWCGRTYPTTISWDRPDKCERLSHGWPDCSPVPAQAEECCADPGQAHGRPSLTLVVHFGLGVNEEKVSKS
jgi:hypothetical protein